MGLVEPVRKTVCGNSANPMGFGFFRLNSCGFDKLRLDLRGQPTERCTHIILPQRRFYIVPACAHAGVCPLEDVFCRGEQHIWVTWRCQLNSTQSPVLYNDEEWFHQDVSQCCQKVYYLFFFFLCVVSLCFFSVAPLASTRL